MDDVRYSLNAVQHEPVNALWVRLEKVPRNIDNRDDIVLARNDVYLLDFLHLPKCICNLRLLPKGCGKVDESSDVPFHPIFGIIVRHGSVISLRSSPIMILYYTFLDPISVLSRSGLNDGLL